jgi:SAM-dependent methyltransferase
MSFRSVVPDVQAWEDAYVRFETPQEEIRKFQRRLRVLGADRWPKDSAIVELFCGRGNGLTALQQLGFTRVLGVDLSPRLATMYRDRSRCLVGDCRQLPLATASHDVALVQGGLHHLPELPQDLEQVVAEVRRVLRPGGIFVVVEPWLTPFLHVVHHVGCSAPGRRLWPKMDALATMIEHERETYAQWLRQPAVIAQILGGRLDPVMKQTGWGKLLFVGRKRVADEDD